MTPPRKFDVLNSLLEQGGTRIDISARSAEDADEKSYRLRKEEKPHDFDLFKERCILISCLVVGTVIILASLNALGWSDKLELRNWGTTSLTSILTGTLGFPLGKSDRKA